MHATHTLPAALGPAPARGEASPSPTPPAAREDLRGSDLALALLGLLSLGACASLGAIGAGGSAALRLAPSVLLVDLAALAMTAPALVAIHQYLRLSASPEALAAGLGRSLVHGGRVAAGLAVLELFFAATTELALPLLMLSLLAVGVFSSATACVELSAAERAASGEPELPPRFGVLLLGWIALGWVIALRVGVDVAGWVLGGGL